MDSDRVQVRASCWTCDAVKYRHVSRRNRRHGHLSWFCEQCDVAWTGPGEPCAGEGDGGSH